MPDPITLFLCGDVMTGRGIDQILPHPADPLIHEPWVRRATEYVRLAEGATGPIPRPIDFAYVWGDALAELERVRPEARLINLETAVTKSDDWWRGKGINYRMHPANLPCLTAARIDCCALANNHLLDWGYGGLAETLETLQQAGIRSAGAGLDLAGAKAPAVLEIAGRGRVLVFSCGTESSGIPLSWAATEERAGVDLLPDLSHATVREIGRRIAAVKRPGDVAVLSIHWGGNWGYGVSREERTFAHRVIDDAGVDLVHGHSSHHVKGIEVYRGRLVIYGCGDFLNDYEGITGYEEFRGDLGLMYFPRLDPSTGRVMELRMMPTRIMHFRVNRASQADARWLAEVISREGAPFGTWADSGEDGSLALRWR